MIDPLLEVIYRQPDDDGARLVYADALLERGDPRGEFISSQLRGVHLRDLLATHGQAWLGPLWGLAMKPGFGRGFLESCTLGAVPREHWASPEWATLRAARLEPECDLGLLLSGAFRGLRSVEASEAALRELLEQPRPLPFSRFVATDEPTELTLQVLATADLKGLRQVSMAFAGPPTRLARRCRELGRRLEMLTWRWDRLEVRFSGTARGPLTCLEVRPARLAAFRGSVALVKRIADLVRALPPGLAEVRVALPSDLAVTADGLAMLEETLRRRPGLSVREVSIAP